MKKEISLVFKPCDVMKYQRFCVLAFAVCLKRCSSFMLHFNSSSASTCSSGKILNYVVLEVN